MRRIPEKTNKPKTKSSFKSHVPTFWQLYKFIPDINACKILHHLLFCSVKQQNGMSCYAVWKHGKKYLVRPRKGWRSRCKLSVKQYDRAIQILIDIGIVEKKIHRFNCVPTTHLHVVPEKAALILSNQRSKFTALRPSKYIPKIGRPVERKSRGKSITQSIIFSTLPKRNDNSSPAAPSVSFPSQKESIHMKANQETAKILQLTLSYLKLEFPKLNTWFSVHGIPTVDLAFKMLFDKGDMNNPEQTLEEILLQLYQEAKGAYEKTEEDGFLFTPNEFKNWVKNYGLPAFKDTYALLRETKPESVRNPSGWMQSGLMHKWAEKTQDSRRNKDFASYFKSVTNCHKMKINSRYCVNESSKEDAYYCLCAETFDKLLAKHYPEEMEKFLKLVPISPNSQNSSSKGYTIDQKDSIGNRHAELKQIDPEEFEWNPDLQHENKKIADKLEFSWHSKPIHIRAHRTIFAKNEEIVFDIPGEESLQIAVNYFDPKFKEKIYDIGRQYFTITKGNPAI